MKEYIKKEVFESGGNGYRLQFEKVMFYDYDNSGTLHKSKNIWTVKIFLYPEHKYFSDFIHGLRLYDKIADRYSYNKTGKTRTRILEYELDKYTESEGCLKCLKLIVEDFEKVLEVV